MGDVCWFSSKVLHSASSKNFREPVYTQSLACVFFESREKSAWSKLLVPKNAWLKAFLYYVSENSHKLYFWLLFWKCTQLKTAPLKAAEAKDPVYINDKLFECTLYLEPYLCLLVFSCVFHTCMRIAFVICPAPLFSLQKKKKCHKPFLISRLSFLW